MRMLGRYTPQLAVHSHMPAPPSTSASDSLTSIDAPISRPFPTSVSDYDSPLHPDHALYTAGHAASGVQARVIKNGYTLELRSYQMTSSTAGAAQRGAKAIRITFPETLVPLSSTCITTAFSTSGRPYLYVVVLLTSNKLVRLRFARNANFAMEGGAAQTFTIEKGWFEEHDLTHDKLQADVGAAAHAVVTEDMVLIGFSDGGILKLERKVDEGKEAWHSHKLSPPFAFSLSRLASFSRDQNLPSQIITVCAPTDGDAPTKAFTLSRDRTLRCWDYRTNSHKAVVSLPPAYYTGSEVAVPGSPTDTDGRGGLLAPTDVSLIQITPNTVETSKFGHFMVVFIPTLRSAVSAGYFRVFGIVKDDGRATELQHDLGGISCSSATRGAELRGFGITPPPGDDAMGSGWKLWAAFDLHGQLLTQVVSLDQQCQYRGYGDANASDSTSQLLDGWSTLSTPSADADALLDAAHFDSLVPLLPHEDQDPLDFTDSEQLFTSHLFKPRRFSILTLQTAMAEYIAFVNNQAASQTLNAIYPSLQAKFAAIVGCALSVQYSPQTGAPMVEAHRRALKREWLGVWARVREIDKEARWPVSVIGSSVGDGVVVGLREGFVVPMTEDVASVLTRLGCKENDEERVAVFEMVPGPFAQSYAALAPPEVRRSMLAVASVGKRLSDTLADRVEDGQDAWSMVENELHNITSSRPMEAPETYGARLWQELVEPYISPDLRAQARTTLAPVSTLAIGQGLDMLASADKIESDQDLPDATSLGVNVTASAIAEIVAARATLARSLILAILFKMEEEESGADDEDEGADELIEMLARAFVMYQRFRVLVWISNQTLDKPVSAPTVRVPDGDEALLESLTGLKMGDFQSSEDGADYGSSALRPLLERWHASPFNSQTGIDALANAAINFLASSGILAGDLYETIATSSDVVQAHALLLEGQASLAQDLAAMYPADTGMTFLWAKASLKLEAVDEAIRGFESVASVTSVPDWTSHDDTGLANIIPENAAAAGLFGYFRHVSALFEASHAEDAKIHFAKLAIEVAPNQEATSPLWSKVFMGHVNQQQFDEAYSALTSMPSRQQKLDCLPVLISVMCEANEVGRLTQFGFVGFQDEVEKTLRFKARNSDPLRFPNYYKVLYSWHIFRGDYRSAGSTMYDQARSLAHGLNKPGQYTAVAAMQARSYLSAINALSLVEARNAWVPVPKAAMENRISKRQKLSHFIPEDEFATKVKPIDIMTVANIKQEYALVLATLELALDFPEITQQNVRPSPTEVVNLFTQAKKFDMAQAAAKSLQVDMTNMFQSLTSLCIELSRLGDMAINAESIAFLQLSPSTSHLRGSPAALSLRYLQLALSRHDDASTHFKYRQAVADRMFESGSGGGWEIPQWLIAMEMERAPEEWISRALKWGWVEEATAWSLEVVRKATPPSMLPTSRGLTAFLPYTLFDRVLAAASGIEAVKSSTAVTNLQKELQTRVRLL